MAKFRYQHIVSSVENKAPEASQLKKAEIAVNDFSGKEALYIKNKDEEVVKFIPEAQTEALIAETSGELSAAIQELDEKKLDISAYTPTDLSNYYTKAEVNAIASAEESARTEADTALAEDIADIEATAVFNAEYVSSAKTINFYNKANEAVATIDATDFIKDGMVDDVKIENGYLVITFNTDAGKETISIPLTDIFNPANYYTKAETSGATELATAFANVYTKAETSAATEVATAFGEVYTEIERVENVAASAFNDLDNRKLDASAYTPTDLSNYYTKQETSGASEIATAFDNVYKKNETSAATEIATAFADVDTALDNVYTKAETSAATEIATAFENVATALDDVYTKAETSAATEIADAIALLQTKADAEDAEYAVSTSLNDLNERKLDVSAYTPTDLSNYYTKDETSAATEIATAFENVATALDNVYTKSETSAATEIATAFNAVYKKNETSAATEIATAFENIEATAVFNAEYVSSAKTIYFYNKANNEVASIDATDFIKDGMVDDVKIENGYLVITFNTDAGKETISIPLTDIFNPANYYTKSETSAATEIADAFDNVYTKAEVDNELERVEEVAASAFNDLNARKLDASAYTPTDLSNYYTKDETSAATEIASAFENVATALDNVYTKAETSAATEIADAFASVDTALDNVYTKAETSAATEIASALNDVYKKDETSAATEIAGAFADVNTALDNVYTKAETSAATEIAGAFADVNTALDNIYTKAETSAATEIADAFANVNTALDNVYTKSETSAATEIADAFASVDTALDNIYTKAETSGASEIADAIALLQTKADAEDVEYAVSTSLNDLDERKLDASAYTPTDLSNYYTKDETSAATEIATAFSNVYKKNETSAATEIASAFNDVYKKNETSGATELSTAFANVYTKSETSAATELTTAFSAIDSTAFFDAEYVSSAKTIYFYNKANEEIASINAADFIKDGMVDDVKIENGNLVITFNTDAGKQDIIIPLTDIFNPANYYTKTQTSGATELATAFANVYTKAETSGKSELATAFANVYTKAETSAATEIADAFDNVYTKSEIETELGRIERVTANAFNDLNERKLDASAYTPTDLSNYYTKQETSGATEIATEFGKYYTKDATSAATELATAFDNVYTKSEIETELGRIERVTAAAFNDLEDKKLDASAYTPTDLSNYYNKQETSGATEIATEFAKYYTKDETSAATEIANAFADVDTALDNVYTKAEVDTEFERVEEVTAAALTDLDERKLDASAYTPTDLSNYYNKQETSAATEIATALNDVYKKNETSAATEIATAFSNVYKKNETSAATEITSAFADVNTALANVYTKSETSAASEIADAIALLQTKADAEDVEYAVSTSLNDLDERKLDASAYTPTDLSNYYNKQETSGATELATEFAKYYTTAQTSGASEIATAFANVYTKSETSAATEIASALTLLATQEYVEEVERVAAAALNDLEDNKLDVSAYTPTDLSNYYTKSETSAATEIATALANVYTKAETSGASEIASAFSNVYKKNETSGATELVTEFAKYYTTAQTSAATEIATAFGDFDTKKLDVSAYTPTDLSNYYTKSETSAATEIATALALLATKEYVEEIERVAAAALNDLNDKLSALEARIELLES